MSIKDDRSEDEDPLLGCFSLVGLVVVDHVTGWTVAALGGRVLWDAWRWFTPQLGVELPALSWHFFAALLYAYTVLTAQTVYRDYKEGAKVVTSRDLWKRLYEVRSGEYVKFISAWLALWLLQSVV